MALALICSGQGRQHPGMFALTAPAPAAAALFDHAAALLGGRDPREFVRTAGSEALHHNRTGQILCTLQALAAAAVLHDALPARIIVAGYSVGEVAAWGFAGLFSPADTLDLVTKRAEAMDAASAAGDGLLYVRGLPGEAIEALTIRHAAAIAIVNPGDGFVIGGDRAALEALRREAIAMKASRVVTIPVEVAAHTARLASASAAFRVALGRCPAPMPLPAGVRLLSGIDAAPVFDIRVGLDKLAAQISHTVRWADCLRACVEAGASGFLELGPGSALSEMTQSAYPHLRSRSTEDFATLDGLKWWVSEGRF